MSSGLLHRTDVARKRLVDFEFLELPKDYSVTDLQRG
jgi:hypothetical protein